MPHQYQQTVAHSFSMTGIGVHSGKPATLTLKPAESDTGIVFIRTDIQDKNNVIKARWDQVVDTKLCTVIGNKDGVTVSTIEHLVSALAALKIDNVIIEIDGPETPIMDGSADAFMMRLEEAGTCLQATPRQAIRILKPIEYVDGDKIARFYPASAMQFSFEIDFASKAVGYQKYSFEMSEDSYKEEIARARTFGFLHEVEMLRTMGLAQGGSLDNAIVIEGDRVLNADGLRFKNECVRHKILDAIGDLYLAGMPILGHFHGVKAGHMMNNKILRVLFADPSAYEIVMLPAEDAAPFTKSTKPSFVGLSA
jgi:UDP-3-O-[3-hydroxymyristoyl] N-acetylglucosamine deacetylase